MTRRRRSVLLASALALTTGAAACEQQPVAKAEEGQRVFASVEECAAEQGETACKAAYDTAWSEHSSTAPKFTDKATCEAEFECEERREGGGSIFMPMMAGYVMGRMMSGSMMSRPIYTDRGGYAYSGGANLGQGQPRGAGGATAAPRTVNASLDDQGRWGATRSATTRGGFGQTSSYRGSAGG